MLTVLTIIVACAAVTALALLLDHRDAARARRSPAAPYGLRPRPAPRDLYAVHGTLLQPVRMQLPGG